MGPSDRLRPLQAGAACTACGATVPTGRIRILASRDDVAFIELDCPACGSEGIGLLIADIDPEAITPIAPGEAAALIDHLHGWDGDLVGWLEAIGHGNPARGGPVVDR
jgi:hypothetical protein